jgi:hypothetical protein
LVLLKVPPVREVVDAISTKLPIPDVIAPVLVFVLEKAPPVCENAWLPVANFTPTVIPLPGAVPRVPEFERLIIPVPLINILPKIIPLVPSPGRPERFPELLRAKDPALTVSAPPDREAPIAEVVLRPLVFVRKTFPPETLIGLLISPCLPDWIKTPAPAVIEPLFVAPTVPPLKFIAVPLTELLL